jgi:hypothetical protein
VSDCPLYEPFSKSTSDLLLCAQEEFCFKNCHNAIRRILYTESEYDQDIGVCHCLAVNERTKHFCMVRDLCDKSESSGKYDKQRKLNRLFTNTYMCLSMYVHGIRHPKLIFSVFLYHEVFAFDMLLLKYSLPSKFYRSDLLQRCVRYLKLLDIDKFSTNMRTM